MIWRIFIIGYGSTAVGTILLFYTDTYFLIPTFLIYAGFRILALLPEFTEDDLQKDGPHA